MGSNPAPSAYGVGSSMVEQWVVSPLVVSSSLSLHPIIKIEIKKNFCYNIYINKRDKEKTNRSVLSIWLDGWLWMPEVQGSNPCSPTYAPMAQLARASDL